MMRVTNEPEDPGRASGPFAQLIRLQSEFQTRLAEETLRYLRHLQGTLGPAAPGTVLMPVADFQLEARGEPGARAQVAVELHNLQRVHCMVTPQVTPLVSSAGVTWFPETEPGSLSRLLSPDQVEMVAFSLVIPDDLPEDVYRGALLLVGFRDNALPLEVVVGKTESATGKAAAGRATRKEPASGKGTRRGKAATPSGSKRKASPPSAAKKKEPPAPSAAKKKGAAPSAAKKKASPPSSAKKKDAASTRTRKKAASPPARRKKAPTRSRTEKEGGSS